MSNRLMTRYAAAFALLSGPLAAGPDDNSLTIGLGEELPGFDGYISTARDGVLLTRHLFDMLIYRNPETFDYEPLLATEWTRIDDSDLGVQAARGRHLSRRIGLHGRGRGVDPHDLCRPGNRRPQPGLRPAGSTVSRQWTDMTVRIVSKDPFPAALEFIAGSLPIYPSDYAQNVGLQEFSQSPIGTGPYRFDGGDSGQFTLKAYEDYLRGRRQGHAVPSTR